MDRPEPRPAAPVSARCAADDVGQPLLPGNGAAALDSLLPFGGKQAGDVARSEDDVYLGRKQRPAGQDIPLASPRSDWITGQPLSLPQIPAGTRMISMAVARQHDSLRGQPGTVAPHRLLHERRARLRLADVQVNTGLDSARHLAPPVGPPPA